MALSVSPSSMASDDTPALLYIDPAAPPTPPLSYRELREQRDAVASTLAAAHGVGPGSLVADFCDEGPSLMLAILGVLGAGATVVPLDPTQPSARLATLLEDCGAAVAICARAAKAQLVLKLEDARSHAVEAPLPPLVALEDLIDVGRRSACCSSGGGGCGDGWLGAASASELSHVIYTSGSTGSPKGVACERRALEAYARAKLASHRIDAGSRVLLCSAHTWDPCIGDVLSTAMAGALLCCAPRGHLVHDMAGAIAALGATHACATPSLFSLMASVAGSASSSASQSSSPSSPLPLPSLRVVALGGEPLRCDLARPWAERGVALLNTYGVTEAAVYQTAHRLTVGGRPSPATNAAAPSDAPPAARAATEEAGTSLEDRVLPAGWPLQGVELAICARSVAARAGAVARARLEQSDQAAAAEAEAEAEAQAGAEGEGEILVGGVQLARGYWRRPALTAERYVDLADEELMVVVRRGVVMRQGRVIEREESGDGDGDGDGATGQLCDGDADGGIADLSLRRRWFRTGDVGRWEGGSSGLRVLGRLDDQVKLRGMRLELGEVEAAARSCSLVAAAAAAIVGGDAEGEKAADAAAAAAAAAAPNYAAVEGRRLVLYVQPRVSAAQFAAGGAGALRVHLRRVLPQPLQPAQVVPLAALPLSAGGKLLRNQLPPPPPLATRAAAGGGDGGGLGAGGGGGSGGAADEAAGAGRGGGGGPLLLTATERAVAAAWEGALGVAGVGRLDHFFELGGNSISAVRMLRRLGTFLAEGDDAPCDAPPHHQAPAPAPGGSGSGGEVQVVRRGDAFERGNQRFATRLCGLYRRPKLRDYAVWLEWAQLAAPNADADATAELATFSKVLRPERAAATAAAAAAAGGGRSAELLAAAAAALPEEEAARAAEAEALCDAAEAGGHEAVAVLLRGRAAVDGVASRHERGTSPLMLAAAAGELTVAAMLLAAGAAVNLPSRAQATPLMLAAGGGGGGDGGGGTNHVRMLALLLRCGAAPLARDANRWSALHHASYAGSAACVTLLLRSSHGAMAMAMAAADVSAQDRWARTPLCWACFGGHAACVAALLRGGAAADGGRRPQLARLERFRNEWSTPLHLAVRAAAAEAAKEGEGQAAEGDGAAVELVRLLLAARADARRGDQHGRTPLQQAEDTGSGCLAVSALLRDAERESAPVAEQAPVPRSLSPRCARGGATDGAALLPLNGSQQRRGGLAADGGGSCAAAWVWPPG